MKDILPTFSNKLYRADIIDIDGNYLAKTVKSIDIGIKTSDIIDKKKLLLSLNIIFPNKDFRKIKKKFNTKKFFWLEKKISEENYEKIMKLGDKSIIPEERVLRVYPQKNLFSHIIGQIDDDNIGISGLEKSFDEILRKSKKPLKLTVDKDKLDVFIDKEATKYKDADQFKQWIAGQPQQLEQFRMMALEEQLVENLENALKSKDKVIRFSELANK